MKELAVSMLLTLVKMRSDVAMRELGSMVLGLSNNEYG